MELTNRYVWFVLIIRLGYGLVGFIDDYRKVALRNTPISPHAVGLLVEAK